MNYKVDVRRRTRAVWNLPEFPIWDSVPLYFSVSKVVFSASTMGLHLDGGRKYRFETVGGLDLTEGLGGRSPVNITGQFPISDELN